MATVKPPSPKTTKPPVPTGGKTAASETTKSSSWKDRFGNLFGDDKKEKTNDKPEQVKEKSTFTKLKDNTNNVANKLINAYFKGDTDTDNLTKKSSSSKILKGILKLMVQIETQRKMDEVQDLKSSKSEEREIERRHREVLKALTVRRKPRKKAKKESTKKDNIEKTKEKQKKATAGNSKTGSKATATKGAGKTTAAAAGATGATAAALPTGALVATTGLLAAASMSVRGETGTADLVKVKGDPKRVGQVVPNDPKPGVSSYGIFGINSGGSVQKFVADNPQFGLTGTPGTKQFDDSWKKVATEKTNEFYNAQLSWYSRYVYEPTRKDMQTALPGNLGSSDKIVTYMADRRNQMGKLYESEAINYAKQSKSPEEFISKIAEHDASEEFIRKAFPTYLKNNGMQNIAGLKNRVELRKQMSMQVKVDSNEGAKIDTKSSENKQMKKEMEQKESTNKVVNNVSVQETNTPQKTIKSVDDRSVFDLLKG